MKKFLQWGAILFFGLIVISALLDEKDKTPPPTQQTRQGDLSVMPDEKDKSPQPAQQARQVASFVMPDPPALPKKFLAVIRTAREKARAAKNDMQRGGILSERNQNICGILQTLRVANWIGHVDDVNSTSDGKGVLSVEIFEDVFIKTWNNALSDAFDNTLLDPRSAIFKAAANLDSGDPVRFSGSFISDQDTCIREGSITLGGKLREPEFLFRFSEIEKL